MTTQQTHFFRRGILPAVATFSAVAVAALLVIFYPIGASAAEPPVGLGTAGSYSVLAGETVTNTGATTLAQSLGLHPGSAVADTGTLLVGGATNLANAAALQAKADLGAAYGNAAGRTPPILVNSELGSTQLTPGVYQVGGDASGDAQVTGTLTLNTQGDPDAVFIFQMARALNTAVDSSVVFLNGATCNVYWQVTSSATIGVRSAFVGTIMASTSVAMQTNATLAGRALARTGEVTLDTNVITQPVCPGATTTPTAPASTSSTAPGGSLPTSPGGGTGTSTGTTKPPKKPALPGLPQTGM